jgi:hypothetical protein
MHSVDSEQGFQDRRLILALVGVLLMGVGIVAAFFGPLEMVCFYFFSEGGRFAYEGFGFGSFMFGNLATQIVGYYFVAALCIPLGYGHLKARRWIRPLTLAALWFWIVLGIPLTVIFLSILLTAKELALGAALAVTAVLGLACLALPWLLIRFYRSRSVRLTLASHDPNPYRIEQVPVPVLVLCALFLFYAVVLHVPIFFNGICPFFGTFLYGLNGIFLLDVAIWSLVLLTWGMARQKRWAWWGSLVYMSLLALSTILSFARTSYLEILAQMRFGPIEMDALDGLPVEGYHLAVFFGVPLLVTVGLIVYAGRYQWRQRGQGENASPASQVRRPRPPSLPSAAPPRDSSPPA